MIHFQRCLAPTRSTSWPDLATLAAQGRWEELEELQDILQGGREG